MQEARFYSNETAKMNTGGQQEVANGKIYYLNMQRGKTLCVYDPKLRTNIQLTADKVSNFSVIGDYIYMNVVTCFVNNDLYRFNYKLGSGLEEVSSDSATGIVGDDNYIYYSRDNAAGAATSIERINLKNNYTQTQIYSKGVSNLRLYENKLYAIDGSKIVTFDLDDLPTDMKNPSSTLSGPKNVDFFEIDDGNVYYSYTNLASNSLRRFALSDPSSETTIAEKKVNPVELKVIGDYVYFLSDIALPTDEYPDGLYRVYKNATTEDTHTLVIAGSTIQDFEIYDDYLYYLDSSWGSALGDSHVYRQSLRDTTAAPERIDDSGF